MQQPVVKTYSTVPMMALKDRKSFSKAIRTAKRVASGKRAAAACTACKKSRARCDDTRPCKRCRSLGICDGCAMPDLADINLVEDAISSVHVRIHDSYVKPVKVDVGTKPELFPVQKQPTYRHPDAAHQEIMHSTFVSMFHLDQSASSLGSDSNCPVMPCHFGARNDASSALFTAYRPDQTILNAAMGSQHASDDFIAKSVHGPVRSAPTGSGIEAMLANLNMLGATCQWNAQYLRYQHQQLQQLQQIQQYQQLLYNQQQLRFSHTHSDLVLGRQGAPPPRAPCPLLAFGATSADVGRF